MSDRSWSLNLHLQEDILFLYKAMEALVASNHAVNPVIPAATAASNPPPDQTSPAAATSVTATALTASSAGGGSAAEGTAVTSNGGGAIACGNGNGHHATADQVLMQTALLLSRESYDYGFMINADRRISDSVRLGDLMQYYGFKIDLFDKSLYDLQRRYSLSDCRSNGSISNVGVDPGGGGSGGGEPGSGGKVNAAV